MKVFIYMKSGNVIDIDGVEDFKIKYCGDEITSLTISVNKDARKRLVVQSIALSQIEAISQEEE